MTEDSDKVRAEALERLANSLDLPTEIMDASGWRNHYSAYLRQGRDFVYLRDVRISADGDIR